MNKIDVTKPLELEDGTPVKLHRLGINLGTVVITILEQPSRWDWDLRWNRMNWSYSLGTGEFITNKKVDQLRLRNCVQETPKLDWTKPLWTKAGEPVKLVATFSDTETFKILFPNLAIYSNECRLVEFPEVGEKSRSFRMAYNENGWLGDKPVSEHDLTNTPPVPKQETFYYGLGKSDAHSRFGVRCARPEDALTSRHGWSSKVLKITYEGSEPVSVELV